MDSYAGIFTGYPSLATNAVSAGASYGQSFETIFNIERRKTAPNFSTLYDITNVLGLPMREFFDFDEVNLTDARQRLLMQLNTMIAQMDDRQLKLLLKLGQVLQEDP